MLRAAWVTPAALVVVFLSSHTLWLSLGQVAPQQSLPPFTQKSRYLLGERWRNAFAHRRDAWENALNVRGGDDLGFGLTCRDPGR